MRTVGVEEELLLVDAHRERMTPVATRVLRIATARGDAGDEDVGRGSLTYELQEQQLELYTSPHHSMSTLEAELRTSRNRAASAAREPGARVVACATSPVPVESRRLRTPRYDKMAVESLHLPAGGGLARGGVLLDDPESSELGLEPVAGSRAFLALG